MISLSHLFNRRNPAIETATVPAPQRRAEKVVAALQQRPVADPLCYIVCREDIPLQSAFPGAACALEPYLLIFTSKHDAQAFIASRCRLYRPEPLTIAAVDSAERLRDLALTPGLDPSFAPPPCGMAVNFVYSSGAAGNTLTPGGVVRLNADQIARALGLEKPGPGKIQGRLR
jgi:hypothetical protein